jgi:hypothetical protein
MRIEVSLLQESGVFKVNGDSQSIHGAESTRESTSKSTCESACLTPSIMESTCPRLVKLLTTHLSEYLRNGDGRSETCTELPHRLTFIFAARREKLVPLTARRSSPRCLKTVRFSPPVCHRPSWGNPYPATTDVSTGNRCPSPFGFVQKNQPIDLLRQVGPGGISIPAAWSLLSTDVASIQHIMEYLDMGF